MTLPLALGQTLVDGAAGLLATAGVLKLRHPLLARAALTKLGLNVRIAGPATACAAVGEIALGLLALFWPVSAVLFALAAVYAVFAVVVLALARWGGGRVSCGCFGSRDVAATPAHALFDVVLALGLLVTALTAAPTGLTRLVAHHPVGGIVAGLALLGLVRLVVALLIDLPEISGLRASAVSAQLPLSSSSPVITLNELGRSSS
jgi:hypothetical protein